jgi:hypothetical protein
MLAPASGAAPCGAAFYFGVASINSHNHLAAAAAD